MSMDTKLRKTGTQRDTKIEHQKLEKRKGGREGEKEEEYGIQLSNLEPGPGKGL